MEIVFRSIFIFFFLWLITRAVGRATLGELSTFQLLLYVTMGDLVQQAVTQQDYSVTAAVMAGGGFPPLPALLSWVDGRDCPPPPGTPGAPGVHAGPGGPGNPEP